MSGFAEDKGDPSSSSSSSRQLPILTSTDDYATWKPLMEHYINDMGCGKVLKMNILDFNALVKARDSFESAMTAYTNLGISFDSDVVVASVKHEGEQKGNKFDDLSAEDKKNLISTVYKIERVYSVIYRAIPHQLRIQIGIEHKGNGNYLWKWLSSTIEPTSIGALSDKYTQLLGMRQHSGERFAVWKARVDALNDRLAGSDFEMRPAAYRYHVLTYTTNDYRSVITNIELTKEMRDDPDDRAGMWLKITNFITNYERAHMKDITDLTSETAMAASASYKPGQKKDYSTFTCHNCGQLGHAKFQCKNKKKKESATAVANSATTIRSDASDHEASQVLHFGLSAIVVQKKSYSAIVGASIATPRTIPPAAAAASSSSSTEAKAQPKRSLAKPTTSASTPVSTSNSFSSLAPKKKALSSASSSSSDERKKSLQDAKVPGPTHSNKGAKPLELRLKQSTWGIDSMASVHCTGNKTLLSNRRSCSPLRILCASGDVAIATSVGTVTLSVRSREGAVRQFKVKDVFYSADLSANLLSVVKLSKDLNMLICHDPTGYAYMKEPGAVGKAGYYMLNTVHSVITIDGDVPAIAYAAATTRRIESVGQLVDAHHRLGHMGFDRLIETLKAGNTRGLGELSMSTADIATARTQVMQCDACKIGKGTQQPYSHRGPLNHGTAPGEVIHMDTFESRVPQEGTLQYGIVMIDPFSSALYCPMVPSKDKVAEIVITVLKQISVLTGNKVKILHSDCGTEFLNHTLKSYCTDNGITMHQSPPRTPQHNGIAERHVRTIKEGARTLMAHCGLTAKWASRAVAHFVYIWNRTHISNYTKMTPYQLFHKMQPSVSSTSIFGCDVYVWIHKDNREAGTYAPRGEPGIYLGHDSKLNCAIVWLIKSGKEVRNRSVDYREHSFKYAHALTAGNAAIDQVVTDSDTGGSLAWYHAEDDSIESRLDYTRQSASETSSVNVNESVSSPTQEGTESDGDESEPAYAVEKIMAHKKSGNSDDGYMYKVKWEDYGERYATWEPKSSLVPGASDLYDEYRAARGLNDVDEVKEDEESASRN